MGNPTGKGGFKKGQSGNPSGMSKEQAEARDLIRKLLLDDSPVVHQMLIARIKEGSDILIKYAHEQLHGKAPDKLEADVKVTPDPFDELTTDELRALVKRG
jgi:hypothetical protein